MNRTVFIGDVHGCFHELDELVQKCRALEDTSSSGNLEFVFVGDLVGKGPDSGKVLDLVMEIQGKSVLGNHDHLLLQAAVEKGRIGDSNPPYRHVSSKRTIHPTSEYMQLADSLTDAQLQFIQSLPLYLEIEEHNVIVAHAGIVPDVPLHEQDPELVLHMRHFRYKDKIPEFYEKHESKDDPECWASLYKGPKRIIFGHDAQRGIQMHPFAIGLDSGCCYGNQLSAYIIPDERLIQVSAKKQYKVPK